MLINLSKPFASRKYSSHVARAPIASSRSLAYRRSCRLHVCAAQAASASDLPASLRKIVGAFQMVPDPMARYKQLLFYATKLEKLPDADHTPANKVEGCVSQVWVKPELRSDGKVYWQADSDSQLTKGLAALLANGLSGCTPEEIITLKPDFIEMLGLKQSLTPSRNNGFLNMLKLMQRKALELMAAQAFVGSESDTNSVDIDAATAIPSSTPIADGIRRKLTEAFKPERLIVDNDSDQHAGHAGARSKEAMKAGNTGETHFSVQVVSEAFAGKTLVQRQRAVYALLQEEFGKGLHALTLDTKTPDEAAVKA